MLQNLLHIPSEIAGYQVFGFGLGLAIWAVASVCIMAWLAWRQGLNADTWGYVPILLLIGAILWWVLPALCDSQGLPIRGYGMMMMLAVVAGTLLAVHRAKRVGVDPELIFSMIFWMVVPGIIGARVFYVIHFWQDEYWPIYCNAGGLGPLLGEIVNIAKGGLVVYGAFFGATAGMILFLRKHSLPLLAVCDLIAPSMMLGLAIGRIGCLLNGCCFGAECQHDWAITFPAGTPPEFTPPYRAQVERGQMWGFTLSADPKAEPRVLDVKPGSPADLAGLKKGDLLRGINPVGVKETLHAHLALNEAFREKMPLQILTTNNRSEIIVPAVEPPPRSLPVHPTQLYSVIDALLLCLLLLAYDPFHRRDGELFALMMTLSPITRFFIEGLRSDEAWVFDTNMSIAQIVSLLLLICAAGLWYYILRQPKGKAFERAVS